MTRTEQSGGIRAVSLHRGASHQIESTAALLSEFCLSAGRRARGSIAIEPLIAAPHSSAICLCFSASLLVALYNYLRAAGYVGDTPFITWGSLCLYLVVLTVLYGIQLSTWLRAGSIRTDRTRLFLWSALVTVLGTALYCTRSGSLPFLSFGDNLRDVSIHARSFLDGLEKDPFADGNYLGFSLIGTTLAIPSEYLFPASVQSHRAATALHATVSVLLFLFVFARLFSFPIAVAGAASFALLPMTLWHARGHLIVLQDLLFMPLALLWLKRGLGDDVKENLRVGFVAGAAMHFQLAIAGVWLLLLALVPALDLPSKLRSRRPGKWIRAVACLTAGFLAALSVRGSHLYALATSIWSRLSGGQAPLEHYVSRYSRTLAGFVQPLFFDFHSPPYPIPVAPYYLSLLAILFVPLALLTGKLRESGGELRVLLAVILLCFTHSAGTDLILGPHRLIILGPLMVYLAASSISLLDRALSPRLPAAAPVLALAFVIPAIPQAHNFFQQIRAADTKGFETQDYNYMAMALARSLPGHAGLGGAACVMTNDARARDTLKLLHMRELLRYFSGMQQGYAVERSPSEEAKGVILAERCLDPHQWERKQGRSLIGRWQEWKFYFVPPEPPS